MERIPAIAALLALGSAYAQNANYVDYRNDRWRYEVTLPPAMSKVTPSRTSASDETFVSPDREFTFWFSGQEIPDGYTADGYLRALRRSTARMAGENGNVTLNVVRPGFFAVSWSEAGTIHYRKGVARGGRFAQMHIMYPLSRKAEADRAITVASRSFRIR